MTIKSGLLSAAEGILADVSFFLSEVDESFYSKPLDILSGSSIGQHTRHIIEFYACLIEQTLSENNINYALRRRDLLIEAHPQHAALKIREIIDSLHKMDFSKTCIVDCSEHGATEIKVDSTIGRELIYNIEHTVHHLAIIKIALRTELPGLQLPEHFGVARSTLQHRLEACAQ